MNSDEKILKILEDLKADIEVLHDGQINLENGQKSLQSDVTVMKGEIEKIPAMENQLDQQGKLLTGVAANTGTVLEEQQAQRIDIRSLHTEVHASKDELKAEILSARAEAKADSIDLKATAMRQLKDHEKRIDALEDITGIPHPDKN
jgi:chromosome segregation ATPase